MPLGNLARPGSTFDDPASFRPLADAQPGGSDPRARLPDMDAEGIDQAVLYPTIGLYFSVVDDPAAAVGLAAAYNDWLAGYCAADPRRLFGAALLPLQDPDAAARELRRAVTELGFVAGFVRPNPCLGRSLSDRAYDVVWDAAEELDVPIGIHEGSSVIVPTLGSDRPFNPLVLHAVSHPFEEMLACAQLIAFGVLERHPGLRCIFLESSGGWAPFWLERLDEQAESFGGFCPDMSLRPSEYFARQCAISFEVDERTLPALAPFVGPGRIVWGSDYPHHDATFPGAVDALRATVAPCPTATQAKILGLNARGIYRLPSRHDGPAALIGDYFAAVTAQDPELLRALFAPDAVFDVDGDCRTGHEDILALLHRAHLRVRGLPARPRPAARRRLHRDGRHRRPPRRGRAHRCATSSRRTARASPRCASAGSPTCCGLPARPDSGRRQRLGLRPAQEPARALARRLVVLAHHDPRLDRGGVAPRPLDQPLARAREVVDHLAAARGPAPRGRSR